MNGLGDHPPHIHGHIIRDLRHPVVNVIKSLTIHKVFHIQRRQSGQMVALQLAIVIQQAAYGRGIFFPASSPSTSTCHWIPIRRANLINGFRPDWANSMTFTLQHQNDGRTGGPVR